MSEVYTPAQARADEAQARLTAAVERLAQAREKSDEAQERAKAAVEYAEEYVHPVLWLLARWLILSPLYLALIAISASDMIGWFAVPLGFPVVTAAQACGVFLITILARQTLAPEITYPAPDPSPPRFEFKMLFVRASAVSGIWIVARLVARLGGLTE